MAPPMQVAAPPKGSISVGWVVVGLVLEEEEPVLVLAVHVHGDLDGAGVDLLGLVEALELAGVLEPLGADRAHVHEADGLLVAAELVAHLQVAVKCRRHDLVVELQVLEGGAKRGVAAVVGPVGVDHADLGDRGHALLARKVLLAEGDVSEVHRQAERVDHGLQLGLVELEEAVKDLDVGGLGVALAQGLALLEGGLARLHGVDHVVLDGGERLVAAGALDHVELGAAHRGALALGDELHALGGGVGALVKLAGQRLHGEHADVLLAHLDGELA